MKSLSSIGEIVKIVAPLLIACGYVWYSILYTTDRVNAMERKQEQLMREYSNACTSIALLQKDIEYIKIAVDELRKRRNS